MGGPYEKSAALGGLYQVVVSRRVPGIAKRVCLGSKTTTQTIIHVQGP